MAVYEPQSDAVVLKLVYCGPRRSGKTATITRLHERYPRARRGRLVRLDTESSHGAFFEYFPVRLGEIDGIAVRLDVLTLPPTVHATPHATGDISSSTARALLGDADGLVFVADTAPGKLSDNIAAWDRVRQALGARQTPTVFQYNKDDLPTRIPATRLAAALHANGSRALSTYAESGAGVWQAHRTVLNALLRRLRVRLPQVRTTGPSSKSSKSAHRDVAFDLWATPSTPITAPSLRPSAPRMPAAPSPNDSDGDGDVSLEARTARRVDGADARPMEGWLRVIAARDGVRQVIFHDERGVIEEQAFSGTEGGDNFAAATALMTNTLNRALSRLRLGGVSRWAVGQRAAWLVAQAPEGILAVAVDETRDGPSALARVLDGEAL